MSTQAQLPERLASFHATYVGRRAGDCLNAFWRANERFLERKRQTLLDVTMEACAAQAQASSGFDELDPLLRQAVRETNPALTERHWFEMDVEQRMGAINAAKGKYFEYLVVERLNAGEQVGDVVLESGQQALLAESMTQPGWDVRIVDADGSVSEYLQMKATASGTYIRQALDRYPDIQIVSTSEVIDGLGGHGMVLDTGISNNELHQQVSHAVDLADQSITEQFVDYFCPLWPLMTIAGIEGYRVSVGQGSLDQFLGRMAVRGQRLLAIKLAGATVFALGGGLLAIPAGLAGGLWFDRFRNLQGLDESYVEHTDRLLSLAVHRLRKLSG